MIRFGVFNTKRDAKSQQTSQDMRRLCLNHSLFSWCILMLVLLEAPQPAQATFLNQEDGILPNHSAQYVRTLNRNASIDADAAFYNPAGLAFMEQPGLYIMFSSQSYYAKRLHQQSYYGIDMDGQGNRQTSNTQDPFLGRLPDEYFAETLAPVLPDLDVIYKTKNWAAYFDLSVMQAAPDMTFPEGLAVMDWGNLATLETGYYASDSKILIYSRDAKAIRTEYYIGATLGGSYAIYDWLSVALGLRYINAQGNQIIRIKNSTAVTEAVDLSDPTQLALQDWDISTDTQGHGFGLILGSHFRPLPDLEVGLRYEYYAPMVLDKTTVRFLAPEAIEKSGSLDIFKDGSPSEEMTYLAGNGSSELKATYPQSLSLGVSYTPMAELRVEVSGELSLGSLRDLDDREEEWNLGYRVGACIEWEFMPNALVSLGYVYHDFGIKPEHRNEADPLLSSHSLGAGVEFRIGDRLRVSLGGFYMFFVPEVLFDQEFTDVTAPTDHYLEKYFDEQRLSVGLGITYRFFGSDVENQTQQATL